MAMKRATIYTVAILLSLALIGSVGLAAGGPERLRQVIGGGGTSAEISGVMLHGTLGQPVAGRVTGDGGVEIGQGYWSGGGKTIYEVYLPITLRQ
jgi:hypothetical protein